MHNSIGNYCFSIGLRESFKSTVVSAKALTAAIESAVANAFAESDSTPSVISESLQDDSKIVMTSMEYNFFMYFTVAKKS
jgi:hypothetical protein